jgi:hypothetical protein
MKSYICGVIWAAALAVVHSAGADEIAPVIVKQLD